MNGLTVPGGRTGVPGARPPVDGPALKGLLKTMEEPFEVDAEAGLLPCEATAEAGMFLGSDAITVVSVVGPIGHLAECLFQT